MINLSIDLALSCARLRSSIRGFRMLNWVGRRSILALLVGLVLPCQAMSVQARTMATHRTHSHNAEARIDAIEAMLADPVHTAPVGDVTRVPYGWADFCTRQPQECRVEVTDAVDIVMNERVLHTIRAVNAKSERRDRAGQQFRSLGDAARPLGLPHRRQGRLQDLRVMEAQDPHRTGLPASGAADDDRP